MSRRPRGTGSVYQRKDGYWVVSVTVAGARIVRYCKTEKKAQELLSQLMVSQQKGTLNRPSHLTLAEWIAQWLEMNSDRLRPSTLRTYRQVLAPVSDFAGTTRLDKLTPLQLTMLFSRMQQIAIGKRRIQLAHTYLKTCLSHAVDLDLLAQNPMHRVKKPQWEPQDRRYWTLEEAQRFLITGLESRSKWAPLFVFLTTSGLRISEALGLTWKDIDWEKGAVHIGRALVWTGYEHAMMAPKTKAGRRDVALTSSALTALRKLPRPIDPDAYVFRTSTGTVPQPSDLRRYLHRLCTLAAVPTTQLHGLRHVAAMLALEAVGDPYLVQRRLGHSHVGVTLQIYGYPGNDQRSVATAIDNVLGSHTG